MNLRALAGLALSWAFAQLSGIVNQYAAVLAPSDPSTLTVDNPAFFSVGDRILVYQAKGATINTTNDNTYGDIIDIGGAGLFEFNKIAGISGNALTLQCPLTRPFNFSNPTTARIQVIKVSYHPGDVTITGTVTAPQWDGQKGGVVVIETEGALTFAADIDVSGRGFRGGLRSQNGGPSNACNATNFHGNADDQAGRKGEGISEWPALNHQAYRGKLANGGGGGNNHNTGGAGGANYGAGGQGGWTTCNSRWWCADYDVTKSGFGIGGAVLSTYLSSISLRLFMGGGGGGGHQNNDQGGNGGNGGGVVIIRAAAINGGGRQIIASGSQGIQNLGGGCNQVNVSFAGNDGGGGGGAGGSVALFCGSFSGNLTIDVRGAKGQDCSSHLCSCTPDHGPGGGGGGGYVALSTANLPPNLTILLSGGQNGIELTPLNENQFGCTNLGNCISDTPSRYHRGATSGAAGGAIYGISFTPYYSCPLSDITLQRWEVCSRPTGTLHHTWTIMSFDSIASISLWLRNIHSNRDYVYAFPVDHQGSYEHPLPPGIYEGLFIARTAAGTILNLGTKLIRHEIPFVWEANQLHISDSQGGAFYLYDPSGRLILTGQPPQTVSLENLPPGLYLLQLGGQTYRLYRWP